MSRRVRRNHTPAFKAKVALAAGAKDSDRGRPGRSGVGEDTRPWGRRRWRANPGQLGDSATFARGGPEVWMSCCRFYICAASRSVISRGPDGVAGQGSAPPVGDFPADSRAAGRVRALAEARSVGATMRVCVGRWRLSAGPHGRRRRVHAGAHRRAPEGKKELGVRESTQSWREFLIDVKQRALQIARKLPSAARWLPEGARRDLSRPRRQRC